MSVSDSRATPSVALVPLDERPVNLRDPHLLAGLGGATLRTPPPELLGAGRQAGATEALADWLAEQAPTADALVVSLNQLCMGGFVPSRITDQDLPTVLAGLCRLRSLGAAHPDVPLRAFLTVMRTRDADDGSVEPSYWAHHGRALFRLSALDHEAAAREPGAGDRLDAARAAVPEAVRGDVLSRRLRHHVLHLAALDAVSDGVLDQLVLACEDTAPWGWSAEERAWLERWIARLELAPHALVYPGADETAGVLLAHSLLAHRRRRPTVFVLVVDEDGLARTPRFEDVPLHRSLPRHLAAAGAEQVDEPEAADLVLALHTPSVVDGDWVADAPTTPHPHAVTLADAVADQISAGRAVAVADTAFANGADPELVAGLNRRRLLPRLAGYAGWNTAGNTLGSALASGLLATQPEADDALRRRLLTVRLLDDWAYQTRVRPRLAARVPLQPGGLVPPELRSRAEHEVREELEGALTELDGLGQQCTVSDDATGLPWRRVFEVSVDVQVDQGERS